MSEQAVVDDSLDNMPLKAIVETNESLCEGTFKKKTLYVLLVSLATMAALSVVNMEYTMDTIIDKISFVDATASFLILMLAVGFAGAAFVDETPMSIPPKKGVEKDLSLSEPLDDESFSESESPNDYSRTSSDTSFDTVSENSDNEEEPQTDEVANRSFSSRSIYETVVGSLTGKPGWLLTKGSCPKEVHEEKASTSVQGDLLSSPRKRELVLQVASTRVMDAAGSAISLDGMSKTAFGDKSSRQLTEDDNAENGARGRRRGQLEVVTTTAVVAAAAGAAFRFPTLLVWCACMIASRRVAFAGFPLPQHQ